MCLRGISAGDFQEVLTALLGKDAPNLSPAVIARLKGEWEDEYQRSTGCGFFRLFKFVFRPLVRQVFLCFLLRSS